MQGRPEIKIPLTRSDRLIEACGWLLLVVLWAYALYSYPRLPDVIPTHYNAAGEPDDYGRKESMLALPAIATFIFAGISALSRFPHVFNYPVKITPANAVAQYTIAVRMLRWIKLAVLLIFALLVFKTHAVTAGGGGLGLWFMPLTLLVIFMPVVYFIVKALSENKRA